ncbi:MAG: hypothetical protein AAGF81_20735 [Pseudomonadota bacterium]
MTTLYNKVQLIQEHARRLYEAHGDKAEYEAAQKARMHDERGEPEEAESWRKVREAISQMRGPHAS